MKPKKRKIYVITYNSGDLIRVGCKTRDWKIALEFYNLWKKNKKAEKQGDYISLDVIEDDKNYMMTSYRTIYRKEVKA